MHVRLGLVLLLALAGCTWRQGIVDVTWPKKVLRLRVGGLYEKDGRYFVDYRPGPEVELFGGGMEPEDTPKKALVREWREELGVEPVVGELRMVVQRRWMTEGVEINQVDLIFEVISAPEFARPRESNHDPRWLTPAEMRRVRGNPAALFERLPLPEGEVVYVEEGER